MLLVELHGIYGRLSKAKAKMAFSAFSLSETAVFVRKSWQEWKKPTSLLVLLEKGRPLDDRLE